MEGPELILSVGEIQSVSVRVVAKDCREVSVKFQVDERHLEIVSEPAERDLGAGTFERIVDWRLRARKPGDKLSIEIMATEGAAPRVVMLPVRILPMPQLEG